MVAKKTVPKIALGTVADPNGPKTHFFYEFEGEQAVVPRILVEDGILLWHEQMHAIELHDVSPIWAFAEELLRTEPEPPTHSRLEYLRFQVLIGRLSPVSWSRREPYPYKWLLISALYFQEARRLCLVEDISRVWQLIAIAYYNLGLNTTKSASQTFATYAEKIRAEETEYKRSLVLWVLGELEGDVSINTVAKAKDAVIEYIQSKKDNTGKYKLFLEFEKLDRLTSENSKHNKDSDAMDRLRATLDSWARQGGPYVEMTDAFAVFQRAARAPVEDEPPLARSTSEEFGFEPREYHTRIFNLMADGKTLTMRFSSNKDEEEGEALSSSS